MSMEVMGVEQRLIMSDYEDKKHFLQKFLEEQKRHNLVQEVENKCHNKRREYFKKKAWREQRQANRKKDKQRRQKQECQQCKGWFSFTCKTSIIIIGVTWMVLM